MRFGHHFYNWDWDWEFDLDRFLRLTKETDWEGVEWKPREGLWATAEEARDKCAEHGVALAAVGGMKEGIQATIDYAHTAGAGIVRCGVAKEEAPRWVEYARERGITICIHNHNGPRGLGSGEVETREDLLRYLDERPGVMGCPDTSNLMWAFSDPAQTIRDLGERCVYAHLKDFDRSRLESEGIAQSMCELGTGDMDVAGVMRALEDIGFDGWVMVERNERMADGDYVASARRMRKVLSDLGY